MTEGYAGWFGFVMQFLDHHWSDSRLHGLGIGDSPASPKIDAPPSVYLKRQAHATFMWDPIAIRNRYVTGIDCLMWGNDYPHKEGSYPFSQEWVDKQFRSPRGRDRHDRGTQHSCSTSPSTDEAIERKRSLRLAAELMVRAKDGGIAMVRRAHWVRTVVVLTAVAVFGTFGASAAAAAPPAGVSMKGTGKPPAGVGLFSSAALAEKSCAENGRTTFAYEGSGPWCVNPWPAGKNNGGATADGVTATNVNVVAYVPNTQMLGPTSAASPQNQATKDPAPLQDVMADWQAAYQYAAEKLGAFQFWGRTVALDLVTASGPDETAQRADAVAVIAKKPFMVVDMTATPRGAPGCSPRSWPATRS